MWAWLPTATAALVDVGGDAVSGEGVEVGGGGRVRPRSRAAVTMASPTGCSLPTSAEATRREQLVGVAGRERDGRGRGWAGRG